jgi:hypothetical protein
MLGSILPQQVQWRKAVTDPPAGVMLASVVLWVSVHQRFCRRMSAFLLIFQ